MSGRCEKCGRPLNYFTGTVRTHDSLGRPMVVCRRCYGNISRECDEVF